MTDNKDRHNVEDNSRQVQLPVTTAAAPAVKGKSENYFFFNPRKLIRDVSQPSLDLTERLEDDDVEGGQDDDRAQLGGDERVDAVEGGVVPANCHQ